MRVDFHLSVKAVRQLCALCEWQSAAYLPELLAEMLTEAFNEAHAPLGQGKYLRLRVLHLLQPDSLAPEELQLLEHVFGEFMSAAGGDVQRHMTWFLVSKPRGEAMEMCWFTTKD